DHRMYTCGLSRTSRKQGAPRVSVVARADIDQIDHQGAESVEVARGRSQARLIVSVKTNQRRGALLLFARHRLFGLGQPVHAMLWRKNDARLDPQFGEDLHRLASLSVEG